MSYSIFNPKEIAVNFTQLTANVRCCEAFQKYVGPSFIHHNINFPGDANSLMIAMEENARNNLEKKLDIQRTLHEEDFVVIHS